VRTTGGVDTFVGQSQPRDGHAADDVAVDDLVDISFANEAVPHHIGVDDDGRTVLALVETARPVRADVSIQSTLGERLLERFLQAIIRIRVARSPRMIRGTLVAADEDVSLKRRH
jgi:hypothetical protein